MVSKKSTNNMVTSQKRQFQITLSGVIVLRNRKSWTNSVAMLLNNSTTLILLKQKTSWNERLLCNSVEKLTTPPSNVLKYILADDSSFAVRPSGTEPKIKFYIANSEKQDAKEKIANIGAEINAFVGE